MQTFYWQHFQRIKTFINHFNANIHHTSKTLNEKNCVQSNASIQYPLDETILSAVLIYATHDYMCYMTYEHTKIHIANASDHM